MSTSAADVFVSHASQDRNTAIAVCHYLERDGIRCWMAPRDIRPGDDWSESILSAITNARVMVVVLSASANDSVHVPREVERAISKSSIVVPLRVEDVSPAASLEYFLSTQHWLDAIDPPLEAHLRKLASTIRSLLDLDESKDSSREESSASESGDAAESFEEIAPDDWYRKKDADKPPKKKTLGGFFRSLFQDGE